MKIRIGVSLFVLLLFIILAIDRCNDSNTVSSVAQPLTIEETRDIKAKAYKLLSEKHQREIDDIYISRLTAFTSGRKFIINKNGDKVNIKKIQTTLVSFKPKEESELESINVYLDEHGKGLLGLQLVKKIRRKTFISII